MTADRRASSSIATTDELCVDHLIAHVDIGQESPVPVPLLDVELQTDLVAVHELTVHVRRIDTDVADLLHSVLDRHFDGVAVNDFENLGSENLGSPSTLRTRKLRKAEELRG